MAIGLAALTPASAAANPIDDLVHADILFEVPGTELIPGVAAVRASCAINASGEPVRLLANGTVRSTIAVSTGPCAIVIVLFGAEVPLPVLNTTPLGRSSFYLPGIATVTLGLVDVTLDLVTSLNSTSRIDGGVASASPSEIVWSAWSATPVAVQGADGVGSVARSSFNTTFTYTMSLALTVYAVSVEVLHWDLATIGRFLGTPSLVTDLEVDLRPHALVLQAPTDVGHDRASLSWSGTVDSDIERIEVRLNDGTLVVTYRVPPTASSVEVVLRPSTHYEARVISIDRAGQEAASETMAFDSAAAPATSPTPVEAQANPAVTWTLVALAVLVPVVGFAAVFLRRRKDD